MQKSDASKQITETIHELKIAPRWYELQMAGLKPWEIRVNDRDYKARDVIHLKEWADGNYTGREMYKKITYVCGDVPYVKDGYVILSTRDVTALEKAMLKEAKEDDCNKGN